MNKYLSVFISCGVVVAGWAGYAAFYASDSHSHGWVPVVHLPFDSHVIDLQISNEEHAVQRDPYGALGWSMLCSTYMNRSRESDDLATAVKAEAAAKRSLELRIMGNVGAWNKLVQALLQEHRFKDALSQCEAAERAGINSDDTTVLHSECLIEVGRYDDAGLIISKNPRAFDNPAGKSVVARMLDISGKPDQAIKLMRQATSEIDLNGGMPSDAIAWFHTRLAIQLAKAGQHVASRQEFETALKMYPRDYKAMAGLARLSVQDGEWQQAVDWGLRSDAVAQLPDVRALVGDAYEMLGEMTKAEEQYQRVAALVGRPSGMNDGLHELNPAAGTHGHRLDRLYAVYCADHNRDLDGAYAAAVRDFDARHDIYAYDTLAWVCFKKGDVSEAQKGIDKALERGTRDPMLWYHAGEIYAGIGETDKASQYLKGALAIDPQFDGIAAKRAANTLQALEANRKIK